MADVGFDRCVIITSTFAAAAALKPPPPRTARGRRSGSVAGSAGRSVDYGCGISSLSHCWPCANKRFTAPFRLHSILLSFFR